MKKPSFEAYIIFIAIILACFLFISRYAKRSDIQELIDIDLSNDFYIVRSYLDGESDYSRRDASESFEKIESELSKLY